MEKKPSKKSVFTWMDLKMHKKLTNDLVEHAKILSKRLYQYEKYVDLECSNFFDPNTIEDYNCIFVSDWEFDCALPYIQFTAIDDADEVREVAEISISFFRMSLPELDKFEKECEKVKKKTDGDKQDEEDYKTFLKLKEKFEGKKK